MEYNVLVPGFNGRVITIDVIKFLKEDQERFTKIKTKDEMEIRLKSMFWSRAEYEMMVSGLFDEDSKKYDIYIWNMEKNLELIWQTCVNEKIIKPAKDVGKFDYTLSKEVYDL